MRLDDCYPLLLSILVIALVLRHRKRDQMRVWRDVILEPPPTREVRIRAIQHAHDETEVKLQALRDALGGHDEELVRTLCSDRRVLRSVRGWDLELELDPLFCEPEMAAVVMQHLETRV